MAARYAQGLSLAKVAAEFGVTRQSAYKMLARRSVPLRSLPPRPAQVWRGAKYTLRPNGYFAATVDGRRYLHRDVWEFSFGPIPEGFDVHHIDEDKTNNDISNLALHDRAEHGRRHGFGGNQHTGSLGRRPVKW
jgi:transcriptional regulator with XRE-family HTH domain